MFLPLGIVRDVAQMVHLVFPGAGQNHRAQAVELPHPAQLDTLRKQPQPLLQHGAHHGQALLLLRIVRRQVRQACEFLRQLLKGRGIRHKVRGVLRDEIAPVPRLCILSRIHNALNLVHYLPGVRDHTLIRIHRL